MESESLKNMDNQEINLEQLRNDINAKAEAIFNNKNDKYAVIFLYGGLIVFEALNFIFGWFPHHLYICIMIGFFILFSVLMGLCIKNCLSAMKRATDARQHWLAAKRLIRRKQLVSVVCFITGALTYEAVLHGLSLIDIVPLIIFLAVGLLSVWIWPSIFIDKEFYNKVTELGHHVD